MVESKYDLRTISLGAGVQSTALYLMACEGLIGPLPDAAIFADTGDEGDWTYKHLNWLKENYNHIIPIHTVKYGVLSADSLASRDGRKRWAAIPFWVRKRDGKKGSSLLRRQCTAEYKIRPIEKFIRELLGLRKGQHAKGKFKVEQWIGISTDEVQRMKPSRSEWVINRWPLIDDLRKSRQGCIDWMQKQGYPIPQRSACVFCPFHDDGFWLWIKKEHPKAFAQAIWFDEQIRMGQLKDTEEKCYLHKSLTPISEINFDKAKDDGKSGRDFANECEGMCGV